MSIDLTVTQSLIFGQETSHAYDLTLLAYGSIGDADKYFANRLRRQTWADASIQDKKSALTEATDWIDKLDYAGSKTSDSQLLQFPRNGDSAVPKEVEKACYEIAVKLLDGMDPELEVKNLGNTSQGLGPARTTYDRAFVLEHLRAGIISEKAWSFLKPLLSDTRTVKLCRVE